MVYLYKMGGRGDARPCARHGHSARRGVEAEKFHVSWDLRSAVSDPMSCVCVCVIRSSGSRPSPPSPPLGPHTARTAGLIHKSESLSSVKMPVSYCKLSKCHSSYGIVRCPGRGHDRAPVPRGCDGTRCRGREDYKIPQALWLRFWVKRRLRARSCRLSATLHSQGWCSYERRRAHPRCL